MTKRKMIDKHYNLINAKYKLSAVEQKLVLSIISLVRPEDEDFKNYIIPISDFEFLAENKNHSRLKKYCKAIMSKPLEISNGTEWIMFNWFSHIRYRNKSLECSISPELKPFLLELQSHYKSYDLKYIINLQSEYAIRIYEILKKNQLLHVIEFDLDELYELLQVPKSYNIYNRFKEKVLQPVSLELAKHSDIYFEFEEIKPSRKITGVKFKIFTNKHVLIEESDYQFNQFRQKIKDEYEDKRVIFHTALDRHITIRNGLLVIEESNTIIEKSKALNLWNYLYENQSKIL
jgi:plasmid replication initiation protein